MSTSPTETSVPKKILIIEDEKDIAEIASLAFEEVKIPFFTCKDKDEFQTLLPEMNQFDALILDLLIPGIDSLDLIFNLRNGNANKPLIFVHSAYGLSDFPWETIGVAGFFEKPHPAFLLRDKVIQAYNEHIQRNYNLRSDFRLPHSFLAHITSSINPKISIGAEGINLSQNGACIKTEQPIPEDLLNQELGVMFNFPLLKNGSNCFQLAQIAWSQSNGKGTQVGLEFTSFPSKIIEQNLDSIRNDLKAKIWKLAAF